MEEKTIDTIEEKNKTAAQYLKNKIYHGTSNTMILCGIVGGTILFATYLFSTTKKTTYGFKVKI